METIFNHNITTNEIQILNILNPGRKIKDIIDYKSSTDDDLRYADLSRLYSMRGNQEAAEKYFKGIKDPTLKYFLTH